MKPRYDYTLSPTLKDKNSGARLSQCGNGLNDVSKECIALMLLNAYLESGNDCQTHIFYGKMCPKTELVESKSP